jgi:hypothetical protein
MTKISLLLALLILWGVSIVEATETANSGTNRDWLGVTPIVSYYPYHTYYSPIHYFPTYSYPWPYAQPYYYYPSYSVSSYPSLFWIGTHGDLPKVLDIARYVSSIRIYSSGIWRTV